MRHVLLAVGLVIATIGEGVAAQAVPLLLKGDKLMLGKRQLSLVSTDVAIGLGGGMGSADDPVVHGGSVRVLSIAGDVFDATYALPATGWRYLKKKGAIVGYSFRGKGGAIHGVIVRAGSLVRVSGSGKGLGHTLGGSPAPVRVVVRVGEQPLCMAFGGAVAFKPGRRFVAKGAPAPARCPLPYGEDSAWLCKPGLAHDQCLEQSLDSTVVHPDLTTTVETAAGSVPSDYDCFYVYPTIDLSGPPGNHEDVTDPAYVSLTLDPLLAQAARFRSLCRIFAPHYRQITFATFGAADAAALLDVAYQDVLDAWRLYQKYDNAGRNVVIMGHSQGTFMTTRLVKEEIDPSPEARARLIAALLIGGSVTVPQGQVVGGSFANVPLCRTPSETGCVIAYRSYADGFPPTGGSNANGGPGEDTACTNPAALGGGPALLAKTYVPTHTNQPLFQVAPDPMLGTAFVEYPQFYTAECVKDDTGHSYLKISVTPGAGDLRTNPIPFTHPVLSPALLGTHILDWSWAMGDLLALVGTKAANMP